MLCASQAAVLAFAAWQSWTQGRGCICQGSWCSCAGFLQASAFFLKQVLYALFKLAYLALAEALTPAVLTFRPGPTGYV
eukprot:scaffold63408_cov20-Tisochrysis_lutea.AAC.1